MSPQQRRRGWIFFVLYLLVFPSEMGLIQRGIGGEFMVAEVSAVYYLLLTAACFLLFRDWLDGSFRLLLDRKWENLFALATGLAGTMLLRFVCWRLPLPVEDPILSGWREEYLLSPGAVVLLVALLMPLVEEVLFRGLLFTALGNRRLAWGLSLSLYALCCVWQFVFAQEGLDPRYLLLVVRYLPLAAGTAWCMDRGGSVWSAVLLHMIWNVTALRAAM